MVSGKRHCWLVFQKTKKFEEIDISFIYLGDSTPFFMVSHPSDTSNSVLSLFFHQIQDARNHVNQALQLLSSHDESYHFKTGAEVNKVCPLPPHAAEQMGDLTPSRCPWHFSSFFLLLLQLMDAVMLQLTRARNRLTTPASMTLPELATSGLMVQDTSCRHCPETGLTNSATRIPVAFWVLLFWLFFPWDLQVFSSFFFSFVLLYLFRGQGL